MMEMLGRGSDYMSIAQQGVHMNLNSALCSLVTPPRRTVQGSKQASMPIDSHIKFKTPPSKAPENQSKSLPKGTATRNSPSRLSPSQLNGKGFYAGAKFGERPPPTELPKPPYHWVSENKQWGSKEQSCIEMTNTLKVLLKVQS
ncbi:Proline-rich nuclear receptor coactivator 2, partial [Stegodyphus mimosarum]